MGKQGGSNVRRKDSAYAAAVPRLAVTGQLTRADNMKAPRNGAFAGDGAELSGPQELWAQFWVPQFPWFQEQLRVELVQALPT